MSDQFRAFPVYNDDLHRYLDRHGRTSDECAAHAEKLDKYAGAVRVVVAALVGGEVVLGREAGSRLVQRLHRSAETLERLGARDRAFVEELELLDEHVDEDEEDAA